MLFYLKEFFMKFTIQKSKIMDVLGRIQGIVGRKTSMAITENVLIRTGDNHIILSATDLETGFEGIYPAMVETGGEAAVNARKLYDIVKIFPTDTILIQEMENRWIQISSENVEYHLVGMDPIEFPDIPAVAGASFFEINSDAFKGMIEKSVIISVPGDEKREHMIGVQLECIAQGNILRMVSTDIKRLSTADVVCDPDAGFRPADPIILPKKGLAEVNKFLEQEGVVLLGTQDNQFIVKKDNETIIINMLDGAFPNYYDLLKIDEAFDVVFDRNALMMMLKRMMIVTSEEYRAVIFYFGNHELITRAVNPNVGESKEKISITFDREPIEVAFNPRFFIEAMGFIETDNVVINIKNSENPCVIRAEKADGYFNVIMPMKF